MKHLQALSLLAMLLLTPAAYAKKWIINNNIPIQARDFASLQAANDASVTVNGDTLYVVGSPYDYSNGNTINITKSFVIIGNGYFHGGTNANPNTPLNQNGSNVGVINLIADNITAIGISAGAINVNNNDHTKISRCYVNGQINLNAAKNPIIFDNYILGIGSSGAMSSTIQIFNNYIGTSIDFNGYYTSFDVTAIMDIHNNVVGAIGLSKPIAFTNQVYNNIIYGQVDLTNGILNNNLLMPGSSIGSFPGSNSANNLCSGTQLPATFGNQQNVPNLTTAGVFKGAAGNSTDGQWQLLSGSPALGAGQSGADCGMFGNVSPYILSGVPPIPTVQAFTIPGTGTTTLPIQAVIRSRN